HRIDPNTVLFQEIDEFIHGDFRRNIALDDFLAFVQGDLTDTATDIAEVGVCHLTRTVDDTAHDGDLHTFEVVCTLSDHGCGLLQIEEGTTATWTADIFCLGDTLSNSL